MAHCDPPWIYDAAADLHPLHEGTTPHGGLATLDRTDVSQEATKQTSTTLAGSGRTVNLESEETLGDSVPAVPLYFDSSGPQSIRFHFPNGAESRPDVPLQIELELHPSRSRWDRLVLPGMPISEQDCADALFLTVDVQCNSRPCVSIEHCVRCRQVENRTAKRGAVKNGSASNTQNHLASPDAQGESSNIVVFNHAQKGTLQICNGHVLVSPRVTCYSSHHPGSQGFELIFTLSDSGGEIVARGRTPPVLIKDDRKKNSTLIMPQHEGPAAAGTFLSPVSTSIPRQDAGASLIVPPSSIQHRLSLSEINAMSPPTDALSLPYQELVNVTPNFLIPQPQAANRAYLPLYADVPVSGHAEPTLRIERINPKLGPVTGGTEVDVFGTGFPFGRNCLFGGNPARTQWYSDTHCVCILPPNCTPGPAEAGFGLPIEGPIQCFTYEDSRENDMAVQVLKIAGWVLLGCDADITNVGVHLFERLGVPPSLLGWVNSRPSAQVQIMETDSEGAALEVLKLLDKNARPDTTSVAKAALLASDTTQTVLHLSASLGLERLSKELIVRGVDPNQCDVNGYTALHFAALYGHVDCARTLVCAGADRGISNKSGCTPREIALNSSHYTLAQLLDPARVVASVTDVAGRRDHENHTSQEEPNETSIPGPFPRSGPRIIMTTIESCRERNAMASHTNSDAEGGDLPLRLPRLFPHAFDEHAPQLYRGPSASITSAPRLTTAPSDEKDNLVASSTLHHDATEDQVSQLPYSVSAPTGNNNPRFAPSEYYEDDLEVVLRWSELPAGIFDEQVGEYNRRRESSMMDQDDLVSLLTAISLAHVEEDTREAFNFARTSILSGDSVGLSVHDDCSQAPPLAQRGTSLVEQYKDSGMLSELDEGINTLRNAIEYLSRDHPIRVACLNHLGSSLLRRFECLGNLADVNEVVTSQQQVVCFIPDGHPDKPACFSNLGFSFLRRFERLGDLADLDEAITAKQQAVRLTPDGHPDKPRRLNNLGISFQSRFERLGGLSDLDEAITVMQQAVRFIPDGHPDKPGLLNTLGNSLLCRFEHLGDLADVEEAITAQRQSVHLPDGHPDKPGHLTCLGNSCLRRYERFGDFADVDEAITALQKAVRLTPDGHPDKPGRLNRFGNSSLRRFERLGDLADVDGAITAQQEAVRLIPDGHPRKPGCLNNLCHSFLCRFERLGDLADLDDAIIAQRRAVYLTPDGDPGKARCLNNLGNSFRNRFQHHGDLDDLAEAITAQRQAVCLISDGHPEKPAHLHDLGISLQSRFERLGNVADIDEAITAQQQAVLLIPYGHPHGPAHLNILGNFFLCRFVRVGGLAHIDEAIAAQQQAIRLIIDHHNKAGRLRDPAISFPRLFECLNSLADIDEAITAEPQATSLLYDHACKPAYVNNLGISFHARMGRQPDDATLTRAISAYTQSATSLSGPLSDRLTAAHKWASLCFAIKSTGTLGAYSTLVNLLPRVVWFDRTVEERYQGIHRIDKLIAEAVVAAISFGELNLALEWLEQSQLLVWGQILQLQTPLNDLRRRHPDVATKLEDITRTLESAGVVQHPNQPTPSAAGPSQTPEEVAQAHRCIAKQHERLLEHIRGLPGFSEFLLPRSFASLCKAAVSGPVIVVTSHEDRCDSLVLLPNPSRVSHVALPGLRVSDTSKMQLRLARLIRQMHIAERHDEAAMLLQWDEEMRDILEQLWMYIAEPILRHLKMLRIPAAGNLPHITWCLTGCLAFFPIHAAGLYREKNQPKIFNYTVSSYTPNLTALVNAKRLPAQHCGTPRLLVVYGSESPAQGSLACGIDAIRALQNKTGRLHVTALNGEEATAEAVLRGMKHCNWIHLACHGIQGLEGKANEAFLIGGELTLHEIMQQSFSHSELAFLSACQTAKGDSWLPEDAMHLAAGILTAGYRSVVGTMWSIRDADAPIIAERFYTYLLAEAGGDSTKAAYALHHAVGHLRDSREGCGFDRWVPFFHLGTCAPTESSGNILPSGPI